MPGPAAVLRELHRLRRHARDLQADIDRGPRLFNAQQLKAARMAALTEQLEQTLQQILEAETSLRDEVRTHYDRLVSHRGEDALSAVLKGTCSACYTGITAQSYNDLVQGQFVLCKSCGRILYLPE